MCRCSKVGYKNIHVIIKCERSEREKIEIELLEEIVIIECKRSELEKIKNWTVESEASEKFLENIALFPPILASLGQIIYFLCRKGQIIYFQHF